MGPRIEVVRGDITAQSVDAIVNAANSSLLGGGGVDGAIHRAGGPEILAACRELRATLYPDGLPTGWAVPTTAGALEATWVIHTVGPVYASDDDPATSLARCHGSVLRVADHIGARRVAFPAISTGAYGFPVHHAAGIALLTVTTLPTDVDLVRFVLFGEDAFREFDRARAAAEERRADREAAEAAAAPVHRAVDGLPPPRPSPAGDDDVIGRTILREAIDGLDGFLDLF